MADEAKTMTDGRRRSDPEGFDPAPLRGNGNSLEVRWGRRGLRLHGVIAVSLFLVLTATVGLTAYRAWMSGVWNTGPRSETLSEEHERIAKEFRRANEELMYVLLADPVEKQRLMRRLQIPERFR